MCFLIFHDSRISKKDSWKKGIEYSYLPGEGDTCFLNKTKKTAIIATFLELLLKFAIPCNLNLISCQYFGRITSYKKKKLMCKFTYLWGGGLLPVIFSLLHLISIHEIYHLFFFFNRHFLTSI